MANDIFRVGKVSSIDYAAGLVRVAYHDKDDSVTAPLPMPVSYTHLDVYKRQA